MTDVIVPGAGMACASVAAELAAECHVVRAQNPSFVLESTAVMHLATPNYVTGACPSGTDPVYRT